MGFPLKVQNIIYIDDLTRIYQNYLETRTKYCGRNSKYAKFYHSYVIFE